MNIKGELAAMEKMITAELVERYAELTDQPVRTRHRAYLIRKIAWRLQADAEGDLTKRARRRAIEHQSGQGRPAADAVPSWSSSGRIWERIGSVGLPRFAAFCRAGDFA